MFFLFSNCIHGNNSLSIKITNSTTELSTALKWKWKLPTFGQPCWLCGLIKVTFGLFWGILCFFYLSLKEVDPLYKLKRFHCPSQHISTILSRMCMSQYSEYTDFSHCLWGDKTLGNKHLQINQSVPTMPDSMNHQFHELSCPDLSKL